MSSIHKLQEELKVYKLVHGKFQVHVHAFEFLLKFVYVFQFPIFTCGEATQVYKSSFSFSSFSSDPQIFGKWPFIAVTRCDKLLPGETSCCQVWPVVVRRDQMLPGVTTCYQVWPAVAGCDQLLPGVTICYQVWPTGFWCDQVAKLKTSYCQVWQAVAMCD